MTGIGRRALVAAGVLLVVAVSLMVPRVARRLDFFRVRQVEVVGARYLDQADVVRRLGLRGAASTFDDLAPVLRAAAAVPGVVGAAVERRLPGTLRVTIREAEPVAIAGTEDHLVLMDSGGRLLPFDPTRQPESLPIAAQDSSVAHLLAHLMHADGALYATVDFARLDRGDVLLDIGSRRIRLRPEADDEVFRAVAAVIHSLNKSETAWREIDARYHSRVFVQKGPT